MADFKRKGSYQSKGGMRGKSDFGRKRDSSRSDRNELTTVICDSCKQKCEVPFKPTSNKPVYCQACFRKDGKSGESGNSSGGGLSEINRKLDQILKLLEM